MEYMCEKVQYHYFIVQADNKLYSDYSDVANTNIISNHDTDKQTRYIGCVRMIFYCQYFNFAGRIACSLTTYHI